MAGAALIAFTGAAMLAATGAQPAGPHLQGEAYLDARTTPFEPLAGTVWTRTRTPLTGDGAQTRIAVAARFGTDWAAWRVEGGAQSLADWRTRRLLTLSADGQTLTNASLYGETRRRLDTYVALSGGGAREEIAFGPAGVFHRVWLEAAMGIAAVTGALGFADTDAGFEAMFEGERVFAADFGDGEDSACEAAPLNGAAARSARLWLRHAAPIHPDVMDRLADEPRFPCAFELVVYSPESPQGRRESWVMAPDAAADAPDAAAPDIAPQAGAAAPAAPQDEAMSLADLLAMFDEGRADGVDAELIMRALAAQNAAGTGPASAGPGAARAAARSPSRPPLDDAPELTLADGAPDADLDMKGADYLEAAGAAALAAVTGAAGRAPDNADFYEAFETARSTGQLAEALLISVQETHHFGPCPQDAMVGGERLTCALVRDLARSGAGNARFERAAEGLDALQEGGYRAATDAFAGFIDADGYAGYAARLLTATALIGWGAESLEARPDLDAAGLMLETLEGDPFASEAYWRLGQRFMEAGEAETAWTLFDLARNLPDREPGPGLEQVEVIETRLAGLAPHWLPPLGD